MIRTPTTACVYCRSKGDHADDCPLAEHVELDPWPRGARNVDTLAPELADFTLGPREVLCVKCWLIHRPNLDCET